MTAAGAQTEAARRLERDGFVRFDPRDASTPPQREWLHFVVSDGRFDVLVNFSVVQGPRGPEGNVLLLARDREGSRWEGDLDDHEVGPADVGGGRIRLHLGGCHVDHDGRFYVRARCRRRPLALDLCLDAEAMPYLVHNVALGEGASVSWLVAPRLRATGALRWGDRVVRLDGATAYHDHNWGRFRGADLRWEWGCSLAPEGPGDALSAVLVRVFEPGGRAASQGLVVWEGAHRRALFRGDEVSFAGEGWLRASQGLRVPRSLSLLAPGPPTDVPARLAVRAEAGGDALRGAFIAEDVARVLVPHDGDLGTTVIHEAVGRMRLDGALGGRAVALDAPAFCEFLGERR